jgi:hypothetical protein
MLPSITRPLIRGGSTWNATQSPSRVARSLSADHELRSAGDAEDVRCHDRAALEWEVAAALDLETRGADCGLGVPGGVAAPGQTRVDVPVVRTFPDGGRAPVVWSHVLVEAKLPARAQTRRSSSSALAWSETLHTTSEATAASKLASGYRSLSAAASTTVAAAALSLAV